MHRNKNLHGLLPTLATCLWLLMHQSYWKPPCHHCISLNSFFRSILSWVQNKKLKKGQQGEKSKSIWQQESQGRTCFPNQPPTVVHVCASVDIMEGFYNDAFRFTSLCFTSNASTNCILWYISSCGSHPDNTTRMSAENTIFLLFLMSGCSFLYQENHGPFNRSWKSVQIRFRKAWKVA